MGIFDTNQNPFAQSKQTIGLGNIKTGTIFDPLIQLGAQFNAQNNDRVIAEQAKAAQQAKLEREAAALQASNARDDAKLTAANTREDAAILAKNKRADKVRLAKDAAALKKAGLKEAATRKTQESFVDLGIKKGIFDANNRDALLTSMGSKVPAISTLNPKKGQNINVSVGSGENEASKAFGKSIGQAAVKRNEQALLAVKGNATLDRLEQSLNKGAKTGIGRETLGNLRNLAQSFGVNIDAGFKALNIETSSLTEEQVINSLGNQLALQLRNPKSGGGLPGATSNRDLEFLKASVPGLSRTQDGNRAMISIARKLNGMKIAVAQEQSRIMSENGGQIPINMEAQLVDFANNLQLFTDQEKQSISDTSSAGSPVTVNIKGKGAVTFPSQDALNTFKSKFPEMVQ